MRKRLSLWIGVVGWMNFERRKAGSYRWFIACWEGLVSLLRIMQLLIQYQIPNDESPPASAMKLYAETTSHEPWEFFPHKKRD